MYLKEKQYKIAMILLCPVQGPWASSIIAAITKLLVFSLLIVSSKNYDSRIRLFSIVMAGFVGWGTVPSKHRIHICYQHRGKLRMDSDGTLE